jgi:hypothetical protein
MAKRARPVDVPTAGMRCQHPFAEPAPAIHRGSPRGGHRLPLSVIEAIEQVSSPSPLLKFVQYAIIHTAESESQGDGARGEHINEEQCSARMQCLFGPGTGRCHGVEGKLEGKMV